MVGTVVGTVVNSSPPPAAAGPPPAAAAPRMDVTVTALPPAPPILSKRERGAYDETMKTHLLAKQSQGLTILKAAMKFKKRAQVARDVVDLRSSGGVELVDTDGDGQVSHEEWVAKYGTDMGFKHYDKDGDGVLDQSELHKMAPALSQEGACAKERSLQRSQSQHDREQKIREGLKLLQQRCEFIEVDVQHMEDDGNCQFRALAHELYGDQQHHAHIRKQVVEHLKAHPDEYSFFVGDESEWQDYLRKMSFDRSWGDELTIRAAADALGCLVHVVTTEKDNWLLKYGEEQNAGSSDQKRECFLAYVNPIHYNVIIPQNKSAVAAPPEAPTATPPAATGAI